MKALIKNIENESFMVHLGHVAEAVGLDSDSTKEYQSIIEQSGIEAAFNWINSFFEGSIDLVPDYNCHYCGEPSEYGHCDNGCEHSSHPL